MVILQTELHRHLDVSIRTTTLLELAQEKGVVPTSTTLQAFKNDLYLTQPLNDLKSVLAKFTLFQKVLDRPNTLERIAFEAIEDCRNEGTKRVELRFSPHFICEYNHLNWSEVLQAFTNGKKRALSKWPEMKVGFLLIAARDYQIDAACEVVEFYLANQTQLLGLDLAGNEDQYPCKLFESAFTPARKANAAITIHAGEAAGPDNIWEAIELLGAKRIGHGINCTQDPLLMDHLARNAICLEMCPTSNYITKAVSSLNHHPLKTVLQHDIPVSINTDDPGIFNVTLPHEFALCQNTLGLSSEQITRCKHHAYTYSFLPK